MRILLHVFFLCFITNLSVSHASIFESFIDPNDGALDVGNWLVNRKGFLPIPLIVTEPAVGVGAGAGVLFFHGSKTSKRKKIDDKRLTLPPSISAVVGGYTENDSWFVGGGHFGGWKEDRIRYLGGVGKASLNLKSYGPSGSDLNESSGERFNINANILVQEITIRIKRSNFFTGGRIIFIGSESQIDRGAILSVPAGRTLHWMDYSIQRPGWPMAGDSDTSLQGSSDFGSAWISPGDRTRRPYI